MRCSITHILSILDFGFFEGLDDGKCKNLTFPNSLKKKRGGIQKLMEVAHVLVGMTPPGSLIYGILDHGFDFLFFGKYNKLSKKVGGKSSQNEV